MHKKNVFLTGLFYLAISILAGAGTCLLFLKTDNGLNVYFDSVAYLRMSRNLLIGLSWNHWPPFFPALLGALQYITSDWYHSLRLTHLFFYFLTGFITGRLVFNHTQDMILGLIGTGFFMFLPGIFNLFSSVYSEPFFLFQITLIFYLQSLYLRNFQIGYLICFSILIATATWTRYAGFPFIPIGYLTIYYYWKSNEKLPWIHLGLFSIFSVGPIGLLLIRNKIFTGHFTDRIFGYYPYTFSELLNGVTDIVEATIGIDLPIGIRITAFFFISIVILGNVLFATSDAPSESMIIPLQWTPPPFVQILFSFLVVNTCFIWFSLTFADSFMPINFRIFVTSILSLGLLLVFLIPHLRKPDYLSNIPVDGTIIKYVFISVFLFIISTNVISLMNSSNRTISISHSKFNHPEVFTRIKSYSDTKPIYTNNQKLIYFYTEKLVKKLPRKYHRGTGEINNRLEQQLQKIENELKEKDGIIVFIQGKHPKYLPSKNELEQKLAIKEVWKQDEYHFYQHEQLQK